MKYSYLHPLALGLAFLSAHSALALDGKVIMLKGEVTWVNSPKGEKKVAQGDVIAQGAMIKTGDKSFAKIVLSDQTNLTVGPKGQVEIAAQPGTDNGLVNLVAGKLRASTPPGAKDGPPKLIIKTQKVSMGVRGTDLRVDFNPTNNLSSLLTFEGSVQMGRIPDIPNATGAEVFSAGATAETIMIGPGQMSTDSPQLPDLMPPVVVNPAQMEQLKGNQTFDSSESGDEGQKKFASAVPPGVDAGAFSADKKALSESLGVALPASAVSNAVAAVAGDTGIMQGGFFSEKAGYIPPPADSRIDENTGLPIPSSSAGGLDESGEYVPPEGLKLMDNGQFVLSADIATTEIKLDDIPMVVGAPPTTYLVTEASFVQAQEEMQNNPDGAAVPGTETGTDGSSGMDSTGAPPPTTMEGMDTTGAEMPSTEEEMAADDLADTLAEEIAADIIQDTIDDITDTANTSTTGTGRSNITITISPL